jgi:hypothetical protein
MRDWLFRNCLALRLEQFIAPDDGSYELPASTCVPALRNVFRSELHRAKLSVSLNCRVIDSNSRAPSEILWDWLKHREEQFTSRPSEFLSISICFYCSFGLNELATASITCCTPRRCPQDGFPTLRRRRTSLCAHLPFRLPRRQPRLRSSFHNDTRQQSRCAGGKVIGSIEREASV